jgi:type II restriction enzyme
MIQLNELVLQITQNNGWKNQSRIVGEASEEYIKSNLNCLRCNKNDFDKCKIDEKSKDLICNNCNQKYQIKAKSATPLQVNKIKSNNTFKTVGAEYSTTLKNINENIDYLILLYDKNSYEVYNILYIKNEFITKECIIPRKPLSSIAKRAGWQGCQIVFNNIQTLIK